MSNMDMQFAVFMLIFIGVLLRMIIPALRKIIEQWDEAGGGFKWNHKYTATCLLSFLIAIVVAFMGLNIFDLQSDVVIDLKYATGVLVFSWGLNSLVTEVAEWVT